MEGKRVALKCSMGVDGVCIAATTRAYNKGGKKKGKLLRRALTPATPRPMLKARYREPLQHCRAQVLRIAWPTGSHSWP